MNRFKSKAASAMRLLQERDALSPPLGGYKPQRDWCLSGMRFDLWKRMHASCVRAEGAERKCDEDMQGSVVQAVPIEASVSEWA